MLALDDKRQPARHDGVRLVVDRVQVRLMLIRLGLHLADAPLPSGRWGFFLVQKRDGERLLIDLYLYQEYG